MTKRSSGMHILILTSSPQSPVPSQKSRLGTQDRDLPGWVCPLAAPISPFPPQFGADVPKATPAPVTTQPFCSVPCREDEEEPNLIYSTLHFHAK